MVIPAGTDVLCAFAWLRELEPWHEAARLPSPLCAALPPCGATGLAVSVTTHLVRELIEAARPRLLAPLVTDAELPHALEPEALRIALADADDPALRVRQPVPDTAVARHAVLADRSAAELEQHVTRLTDCARDPRWNHTAVGERFRMDRLSHAQRCRTAASDVRRAAKRLGT